MIPLVDMHCHLLSGLDDGPRTEEDALEMCRISYGEGIRLSAALAHQSERWNAVTPEVIRDRVRKLTHSRCGGSDPSDRFPVCRSDGRTWDRRRVGAGELLSVADRGEYVLVEMPHGLFLDLRNLIGGFRAAGVRPIVAHPERHPELLHDPGRVEQLIQTGCLIQVSSSSVTDPPDSRDARALKDWFRRGVVHLLGSDGHSPRRRQPRMEQAYRQIARWAGDSVADRVCSTNATAVVHGLPLQITPPEPRRSRWFFRFW